MFISCLFWKFPLFLHIVPYQFLDVLCLLTKIVVLRLDKNQVTMPIIWIGFVQDGIFTV